NTVIVASADKHGSRGRKLVAEARRSDRPAEPSTQDGLAPTTRTLPHLLATEILDCAPDGIIAVDRKGYVLYANRAFAAMLGHEPDDLRRMRVQDLVTPDTSARALDELAVLFSQPTYRGEM